MKIPIRINDPSVIDIGLIEKEIDADKHVIIQFSKALYTDSQLSIIDTLCKKYNSAFGVRFFGHYLGSFDFKTLQKIPNVKCLYVDCLTKAENVQALGELEKLEKFSLGVFELKEPEILNIQSLKNLSEIIITDTQTKALNLGYLKDYNRLNRLTICGHKKNIEALGEILTLEFLSLNSIKKTTVSFVNNLKKLKTLRFILGGRESIQEINENEIENLEIVWVRGFKDLSNISNFKSLKTLLVEDNKQLSNIHFDKELVKLNDVKILNCKTLSSLTGLEKLISLQQLRIYKTNLDIDSLLKQTLPNTLKTFAFYTYKKKIDEAIRLTLDNIGYKS
jgi:protein phosphatase 1 regulatory subunit 7